MKTCQRPFRKRLDTKGYYEAAAPPRPLSPQMAPVIFCLTVDDFGIEYVGKQYAQHIFSTVQELYMVTIDSEGKKYADIDLERD